MNFFQRQQSVMVEKRQFEQKMNKRKRTLKSIFRRRRTMDDQKDDNDSSCSASDCEKHSKDRCLKVEPDSCDSDNELNQY